MTSSIRLSLTALAACFVLASGAHAQYGPPPPAPTPPAPTPTPTPPPAGGQTLATRTVKVATLDGAQETPPKNTMGFGAGVLVVDETSGKVRGFVVTSGLVDTTAAHVHLAARGTPGNIIVPMTGGPDVWVVPDAAAPLTMDQIAAFKSDTLYFNVHTKVNPDGEIRGQIDKKGTARQASLDGAQETPPVTTPGLGGAILVVDEMTGKLGGFIMTSGLVGTQAQLYEAARGTAGPIIVPLTGGPSLWVVPDGAAALPADQRVAFTTDGLYYAVHTTANPNGEIRGQLDKKGALALAALDGPQETPPVMTNAFGGGTLAVDLPSGQVSGFVVTSGLDTGNAAHVHQAARGTPGNIIVPMIGAKNFWVIPDAAPPITAAQQAAFMTGGLYENVHTPAHPNGEIRGQVD
jgi:hypothetical protein